MKERFSAAMTQDGEKSYWEECEAKDFKVFEYIEALARKTVIQINGQMYRYKTEKHDVSK
jgi:hypothetical protein